MKIKLLEPIEGYEEEAEYRTLAPSECKHFTMDGKQVLFGASAREVFVLTPKKQWRAATIKDAIDALNGEKIFARFKHKRSVDDQWIVQDFLAGVVRGGDALHWHSQCRLPGDNGYAYCEVCR
jgi:hypothetical protein